MRIAVLCATRRGFRFLEKLATLTPGAEFVVFTFPEEPWEPPFRQDIRRLAERYGAAYFESRNVGGEQWREFWERTPIDLMLAVSWRYLIPSRIYERPRLGSFVFHDSLLPAYRGFAPTVWAIINGEDHTGVTAFAMADDVDSGDIVAQRRVPIGPDDTIAEVMERVTEAYLETLEAILPELLAGSAPHQPQDHDQATFTCRRLPEDNQIDWSRPTDDVYNLIRAVGRPYTGAYSWLEGERLRVWAARRVPGARRFVGRIPGRVVEVRRGEGSVVLTGEGLLLLTEVQLDDQPPVRADEILNKLGQTLGPKARS